MPDADSNAKGAPTRREFLRFALGVMAGPSLLACDSPTGPGDPRLTARPHEPGTSVALGRTILDLDPGRDGFLYVPPGYDPTTPAPLFVALHGAGQYAEEWESYIPRADSRGMVLLVPESRGWTWDLVRGSYGPDVAFLNQALSFTFDRCRIDPEKVCLAGFSDGASYALSLGVSNGDLFTHLVGYSPGFLAMIEPLVGKPKAFVSHGQMDPVLSYRMTRDWIVPLLEQQGYDVTFRLFRGEHEVPAFVSQAALDWFVPTA